MVTILDFAAIEVPIGTQSLPLNLTPGVEIFLTSIFLNAPTTSSSIVMYSTIGWEGQLGLLTVLPKLTFRIRRGGFAPNAPIVFETTDSAFVGTGNLIPLITLDFTTGFSHVGSPDPATVGTFQQYFLTATLTGTGGATIVGPVDLIGEVIG